MDISMDISVDISMDMDIHGKPENLPLDLTAISRYCTFWIFIFYKVV